MKDVMDRIIEALKGVYDPEIPIDVYNLGLIYDISVKETKDGLSVKITMGLTSPFCPLTSSIGYAVELMVKEAVPEVKEVIVEFSLDPPWTPKNITPEGREKLKVIYGYDIVGEMLKSLES